MWKKFSHFVYSDLSEEFISIRLPPHLQAPELFLFLHKKTMGAPGGKLITLLIKALFYSESGFVQTYLQVYLIRRIRVIYLQIYLIRNSLVWFGFMAKSGL